MGYTKYWNFERLRDKVANALHVERGLIRNGHFREIEEMVQLGNGTARRVTSVLLSRAACMGISCNADQRKPMVKMAHGNISKKKALGEYEKYRVIQDQTFPSDFEKFLNEINNPR